LISEFPIGFRKERSLAEKPVLAGDTESRKSSGERIDVDSGNAHRVGHLVRGVQWRQFVVPADRANAYFIDDIGSNYLGVIRSRGPVFVGREVILGVAANVRSRQKAGVRRRGKHPWV